MQTRSLGGELYFLIFFGDKSRYTWVYFIRKKSDAFQYFKESKTWWKIKLGNISKFLDLIMGEHKNQEILINIVKVMGFYNNL